MCHTQARTARTSENRVLQGRRNSANWLKGRFKHGAVYSGRGLGGVQLYTEEIDEMGAIESDINGYIEQMVPQFIQGKVPSQNGITMYPQLRK